MFSPCTTYNPSDSTRATNAQALKSWAVRLRCTNTIWGKFCARAKPPATHPNRRVMRGVASEEKRRKEQQYLRFFVLFIQVVFQASEAAPSPVSRWA